MQFAYQCIRLAVIILVSLIWGCGKQDASPMNTPPTSVPGAPGSPAAGASTQAPAPPKGDTGSVKIDLKFDDPKALITVDGNQYLIKELAEAVPLPVGEHQVVLKIGGQDTAQRTIQVEKDKRVVVQFGEPNREVAEWVLRAGGDIKIAPNHTPIKTVAELPAMPFEVTWIGMSNKPLTDSDLELVQGLQSLKQLGLASKMVTDKGLLKLWHLPALDYINLELKCPWLGLVHTQITDLGLVHLAGMTQLTNLQLGGTKITDQGLEQLKGLVELHQLGLGNTAITDAGLAHLTSLSKLQYLHLHKTAVTDAGIAKLKAVLPKCQVNK